MLPKKFLLALIFAAVAVLARNSAQLLPGDIDRDLQEEYMDSDMPSGIPSGYPSDFPSDYPSGYPSDMPSSICPEGPPLCDDGSCGDCTIPRFNEGCSCERCECIVCEVDPFCCNQIWDGICVTQAVTLCGCEIAADAEGVDASRGSP
ncbi:hypothetical protein ACA910_012353 [Epithemia clementina (nom. ined.)]